MMKIKKGAKATRDGVILTDKEYEELINYRDTVLALRSYKKDYNLTYRSYLG
ncbi:hypothetical protein PXD04_10065 [Methanosphaera sp. ISO3-F5]|uniref:hypothetical protein n=1 Tax=Methanosphaera sp. ISO3-F5 TaxID=1452353 RepID=UPI002B262144|nr:hypothetical protein [Methanosphaera sp. ISO3-F5]WQH64034.1 hypothetical protein PXD04_10065 [Methanosphaera sp. ISO3-F5]